MAADQSLKIKSVDASLWWDSFVALLTELENVSISVDLPPSLEKKLEDNHAWFLDTVSLFKPPNQKSREALDSHQVKIGSHQLTVQLELKSAALKISNLLCLDEVQSYVLVKRAIECNTVAADHIVPELLHLVMLQYYIERQCLLKCIRQILMHTLYFGTVSKESCSMRKVVQKLIFDGLEDKLLSIFEMLLSSSYPVHMDVDLYTLWAEEILIEDNLVLEIIFLSYYESFCSCNGKQWKRLCLLYEGIISGSFNFGKLALSTEAIRSICEAKIRLLFILMETLDLENLLQMVHDEVPFRKGSTAFSLIDIQEIDATISSFTVSDIKEAGPLILSWAVFLCLISSLPEGEENSILMEIDHVGYVRQAFEAAALSSFLEILRSNVLKDSDGTFAGYRSVLRTFISAFIASYEINLQLEDGNLKLILDILCKIYQGEESLCIQFWDRDSFIDGPIRCLLCNLEGEFPLRTIELGRLLSALSEGTWPAECVYNFLDKSVGLSSLFDVDSGLVMDNVSHTVETHLPVCIPGIEGLYIPSGTRGRVLKLIDGNTAVIRWEYTQSGVLVVLLRLAQQLYSNNMEEVLVTLDLLCRLTTFNTAVCYALLDMRNSLHDEDNQVNGNIDKHIRIDVVDIICILVKNLPSNSDGAVLMSMSVMILAKMLKCTPCYVTTMALKANVFDFTSRMYPFDVNSNGSSSNSWLPSGRLAKMLLIDCEQNDGWCPLTISVLDFIMQLVETGVQNDSALALMIFSLQYILVNHENWKFKMKHIRWKVTLKVLEVLRICISSIQYCQKQREVIREILLCDSSIHSALFHIVCRTTQSLEKLYLSRLYDVLDIEGLQLAICSVLDILFSMLSNLSKEILPSIPVFVQGMLSSTTKPLPVSAAMISLISCFRNPNIQVGAARVLSMLFIIANHSQAYVSENASFGLDDKQIAEFRYSVIRILHEQTPWNEDLIIATFKLLTYAAHYQPAFLVAVIVAKESSDVQLSNGNETKEPNEATAGLHLFPETNMLDTILEYVGRSDDLIKSNPKMLLNVLNFLKVLWQGAAQFTNFLEWLKKSDKFWKQLSNSILLVAAVRDCPSETPADAKVRKTAYRYQCQCSVLQIMAYEIFLKKKMLYAESLARQTLESSKGGIEIAAVPEKTKSAGDLEDFLSTWFRSPELSNLIKAYTLCEYDNSTCLRAKIAAALFAVHAMGKLKSGDTGSLSISLIEKLRTLSEKLCSLPPFLELLNQYTQNGYSKGKELTMLIFNDLYYHLQGELEGRKIEHRPFRELSQYLLESDLLKTYWQKYDECLLPSARDVYLLDCNQLQADMGLDLWKFSSWKESKEMVDTLLLCLQDVNSMALLISSKLTALKALITMLHVYNEDQTQKAEMGGKIPEQLILPFIDLVCQSLNAAIESLAPVPDASPDILDFVAAQVELLLIFIRFLCKGIPLLSCMLILKTTGSGLKLLNDFKLSIAGVNPVVKLLLRLLLSSIKFSCLNSELFAVSGMESVENIAEASNVSLGLLPVLCSCIEPADHCSLSLAAMDLIIKGFLTPTTWLPIFHKHLQLQHIVQKLQDKNSLVANPVVLKFFLTLARVRGGAEMLLNTGLFVSLRTLFVGLSDGSPFSLIQNETIHSNSSNHFDETHHLWGLGLALVTAVIQSLRDSCFTDTVDYVIDNFLSDKACLVLHNLSAPEFLSEVHGKKRSRAQNTQSNLSALKDAEHILMLICMLAKYRNSWIKGMKEMDAHIREKGIHFLAFISRGTQRIVESSTRVTPLLCHPVLKEEFEWCKNPSFVNSKKGWFALAPLGCGLNFDFSTISSGTTAFVLRKQVAENIDLAPQTYFSDTVAIQLYRIAFLLLKFMCLQVEFASKRAEEVEFIDLAHFPELPVPEILHGLQDQGISIVTELCEANKLKQVSSEIQGVCFLLLQMTVMSLYLELCVLQICGIRPVLGRTEDFLKELKLFLKATEGHAFLKESVKSFKQIVSFVYPGLLQSEGFL